MSRYQGLIKDVVAKPEVVIRGIRGELKAVSYLDETRLGPKYLVVVYRELKGEKAIITAYFTSDLKKVKGELVWKV